MPSCVGNAFHKCPRGDKGSAQLHALYQCQHDDSCYGQILLFLHTLPHEDKWTNTTGKNKKNKFDRMPLFVSLIVLRFKTLSQDRTFCQYSVKLIATIFGINFLYFLLIRFRVLFVHMLPCLALVVLNILLFLAMFEADRKRERLLKTRMVSTTSSNQGSTSTNNTKSVGGESKETKKIRDTNNTTLMLVVVITVTIL